MEANLRTIKIELAVQEIEIVTDQLNYFPTAAGWDYTWMAMVTVRNRAQYLKAANRTVLDNGLTPTNAGEAHNHVGFS